MKTRSSHASRSGFTFIEALITLVVASLILTAVFSLARRMTSDAGQLEGRLRSVVERASSETGLRLLFGALVVAPAEARNGTVAPGPLLGTGATLEGTLAASRPVPCLPRPGTFPVTLSLVDNPDGSQALECTIGGSTQRVADFPDGGARFRFLDRDTGAVLDLWPPTGRRDQAGPRSPFETVQTGAAQVTRSGHPPLVMLEWRDGSTTRSVLAPTLPSGPARPDPAEFDDRPVDTP